MRRINHRIGASAAALMLGIAGSIAHADTPGAEPGTYTNAVSQSFADTYADPAVIDAQDGWTYAYATADPLRAGDPPGIGHIARTRDWIEWEYLGPIFTESNRPSWATSSAGLWAPDVRYIDGQYVMYFTVTDTTLNTDDWDPAIGVATADSPAGPWTPTEEPLIAPSQGDDGRFLNTIDPAGFTDTEGRNYLYWGNYFGGMHVIELDHTGLQTVGESNLVGAWDRYEAAYVTHRDGWYYLTGSSANCCAGPSTGYSVFVGRSRSPRGPFLDKEGLDMTASVTGGSVLLTQNGNRWIGAGHHAMMTDASGKDWIVYHAIDRDEPWLTEPYGINRRPMLIDPVDWIDGWPEVRAGRGPSEGPQTAPVTASLLDATSWAPADGFRNMAAGSDPAGGDVGVVKGNARSTTDLPAGDVRVSVDVLLGEDAVTLDLGHGLTATLDPTSETFRVKARGDHGETALRATDGWRRVTVTVRGDEVVAEVSEGGQSNASSHVSLTAKNLKREARPLSIKGAGLVDNVKVAKPAVEPTELAPQPEPTAELWREDFTCGVSDRWQWVREDEAVEVRDGSMHWPLRAVDLAEANNSAPLLLTEAGEGDWIIETEFTLDLGEDDVRNHQQAGLIAYNDDDDFARLSAVAIWGTRTVEFGREHRVAEDDDRTIFGGAIVGPTAPTMRMRLAHHMNDAGEHLYRSAISRDGGDTWIWGATWVLDEGTSPLVGLHAGGGAQPEAAAEFHWVSMSEATWPEDE